MEKEKKEKSRSEKLINEFLRQKIYKGKAASKKLRNKK